MNRIKSLDGLRAVSIIMVFLAHAGHVVPVSIASSPLFMYAANGALGVKFFFVISGYLITRLLLVEEKKTGTINIKAFYVRRVLRIFPVFYLYILVVVLLKWFFVPDIFSSYSLVALAGLYLWNYRQVLDTTASPDDKGSWYFGHFWSLSMEEQFYLLWPVTVKHLSKERLVTLTTVIIGIIPLVRLFTYFVAPDSRGQIGVTLHTGVDTILTGCLGALLESKILANRRINYLLHNNLVILFLWVFLFVLSIKLNPLLNEAGWLSVGITLYNFTILFLLLWCVHVPSVVARLLNTRVFVHIGVLSYSLYVWQQLFLTDREFYWPTAFPQNILLAIMAAVLSYYAFEKPIIALKEQVKLNRKKAPKQTARPTLYRPMVDQQQTLT